MDGWIEIKACPYCGGSVKPYKSVISAPAMLVRFCNGTLPMLASITYVKCSCGLVIQSPRMTDERIDYYYSSGLYRDTLGMSVEAMDADEQRRAADVANWLDLYPKRHLDIGASRGYLLNQIDAEVKHGFDNNPNYGQGIQVYSNKAHLQTYDLVTSVHCLEHVTDPISELLWYKSVTAGMLFIEVPGENTLGGALRFAHLYYYPPELLFDMVQSIGMKIIKTETEPNTRVLCMA
jgi:hypothetical protein